MKRYSSTRSLSPRKFCSSHASPTGFHATRSLLGYCLHAIRSGPRTTPGRNFLVHCSDPPFRGILSMFSFLSLCLCFCFAFAFASSLVFTSSSVPPLRPLGSVPGLLTFATLRLGGCFLPAIPSHVAIRTAPRAITLESLGLIMSNC